MEITELKKDYVVLTGLCYGYSTATSTDMCTMPLMVAKIGNIINNGVCPLVQIVQNPETYTHPENIHGIPLNKYILKILGFEEKPNHTSKYPGPVKKKGIYEATIDNELIQIYEDGPKFYLCISCSREMIPVYYVHDIQKNKTHNGQVLKIDYRLFYDLD